MDTLQELAIALDWSARLDASAERRYADADAVGLLRAEEMDYWAADYQEGAAVVAYGRMWRSTGTGHWELKD